MSNAQQAESNRQDSGRWHFGTFRGVVAGGLVGIGFAVGSLAGGANPVTASQSAWPVVVNQRIQPPVIAIPNDGVAIIGASDDLYYLVKSDGSTSVLTGLRREDLCWRRVDER